MSQFLSACTHRAASALPTHRAASLLSQHVRAGTGLAKEGASAEKRKLCSHLQASPVASAAAARQLRKQQLQACQLQQQLRHQ
jgi:hypothetical protein